MLGSNNSLVTFLAQVRFSPVCHSKCQCGQGKAARLHSNHVRPCCHARSMQCGGGLQRLRLRLGEDEHANVTAAACMVQFRNLKSRHVE